jgi:hypothetical protein
LILTHEPAKAGAVQAMVMARMDRIFRMVFLIWNYKIRIIFPTSACKSIPGGGTATGQIVPPA